MFCVDFISISVQECKNSGLYLFEWIQPLFLPSLTERVQTPY